MQPKRDFTLDAATTNLLPEVPGCTEAALRQQARCGCIDATFLLWLH